MRKLFLLAIIFSCHAEQQSCASEPEFPTINTVSRFFGVGYSRHGYHSAVDGRFNAVTERHASICYPSQQLLHPYYAPSYQRPTSVRPLPVQPQYAPPSVSIVEPVESVPAVPAKPAEPPPEWLEQYLNEETLAPPKSDRSLNDKDASPSDRNADDDLLMFSPQPIELNLQPANEFHSPTSNGYRVATDPRTPTSYHRSPK